MTTPSIPFTSPIRVLCVDDNRDITAGLRMLIAADPGMRCIGCLASVEALVEELRGLSDTPDVIILDATMPGRSSTEALEEVATACPQSRTLMYSGHDDPMLINEAKLAGAWGWVCKDQAIQSLLRAVQEVAAGRPVWPRTSGAGTFPRGA